MFGVVRRIVLLLVVTGLALTGLAVPASAATGVDVSSWNHPNGAAINWGAVRAAGHTFAFVKADEGPGSPGGSYYTNPYFATDWAGAGSVGMYRGAYHYARPKLPLSTALEDARHFVSVTGTMRGPRDLPPVLDLESSGGLSGPAIVDWAITWLNEVERLTGRRPIIYLGYYFWKDVLGSTTRLASWRLWLPWYTTAPAPGAVPSPWGTWTFWQYTSTGQVPGIASNTDINRYCCSDANLAALASSGGAPAASNPFGSFDGVARGPNRISVSGWAIDPDTTSPIKVHVYVNNVFQGEHNANGSRPDIASAYPGFGANHGFTVEVPTGGGPLNVCVYAMNVGAGNANSLLGCRSVLSNPVGSLDGAWQQPGDAVRISGWAIDPDSPAAIDVGVFVNGQPFAAQHANLPRPDVQSVFGLASANHGYDLVLNGLSGRNDICVFGINVGDGDHGFHGCRTLTLAANPIGSFDSVQVGETGARVKGWALDPGTTASIQVHAYVDGAFAGAFTANNSRPDVGAFFSGYGNDHGFDVLIPNLTNAPHSVCMFAINVGTGSVNTFLGCRSVSPRNHPFGSLDSVTSPGSAIRAAGWTIDPDTSAPLDVHIYVDGTFAGATVADLSRPDVEAVVPGFGAEHGFDATLAASPGSHQVCVFALNVSTGLGHAFLGCRTVTV